MNHNSFSSGELARQAGVSPDTLRHYERNGLLPEPPRGTNGYRRYAQSALQRVLLIRRALHVGFTIDELRGVLRTRDCGGAPCTRVRDIAAKKLVAVEEQLKELKKLRSELRVALREWDQCLARTPPGKPAHLLELLPTPVKNRSWRGKAFSTDTKAKRKDRDK